MAMGSLSFANAVQDVRITPLNTNILVSCEDQVNGNFYRLLLDKTSLSTNSNMTIPGLAQGLYIQPYDYLVMSR